MAELPQKTITPSVPKVIPAVAEKVYDRVRVKKMELLAENGNRPASLDAELAYYHMDDSGDAPIVVDHEETARIQVDDLFRQAAFDADVVAAVESLMGGLTPQQQMGVAVTAVQIASETYGKATGAI